ncbi:phosphatase PAP2 family protein [Gracilibacillus alcaliphilus]|uniref:phosphatase PAP2 family protein n=1 Tax=Gracilibacillus alcaliphilus TaxID=1401441 RepID=UPI00195D70A6|nr:phosphatase PAP2 family protein [Gracilibacillus alcaliphilus]MBM7676328.1 undecaprenyl-diphosphatase [Gracilibacillus alcaliphilus]
MNHVVKRLKVLAIVAAVALVVFICLAIAVSKDTAFSVDTFFQQGDHFAEASLLYQVMGTLTHAGSVWFLTTATIVVAAALWFSKYSNWYSLYFCINMIGISILIKVLKTVIGRERPEVIAQYDGTGFSFPSGHAAGSFAFYGLLSYLLWRHLSRKTVKWFAVVLLLIVTLIIACSRVVLSVHFVTDITAGIALSTVWLFICIFALEYTLSRQPSAAD